MALSPGSLCFADNPIAIFGESGNTKHHAGLSGTQQNIRASLSKFIMKLDIWILHFIHKKSLIAWHRPSRGNNRTEPV
jgi:hypothetical protein